MENKGQLNNNQDNFIYINKFHWGYIDLLKYATSDKMANFKY